MRTSIAVLLLLIAPVARAADGPWPVAKAQAWGEKTPWLVGCNFSPSTAINQLEMWQAETFDLPTIDRELGWAEGLGFNSVRVFLHNIPFDKDPEGFLKRVDAFVDAAARHKIGATFVLLDSVWDPYPKPGPQPPPRPGLHNSGWVQCPGRAILEDPRRHKELEPYIKGVVGRYKDDPRVQVWDLFNEPDNTNGGSYGKDEPAGKAELSLALLKSAFAWAREVGPSQPITSGVWVGDWSDASKLSPTNKFLLEQSDVISMHNYGPLDEIRRRLDPLARYGRPILCTEYMARPIGSRFDPVLGELKARKVGAYCWGFVAGKTNTIYPWDSWKKPYSADPPTWFHDIFRADGTPYDAAEVRYIRKVTGKG